MVEPPPYVRIVADIRRRIDSGELRAGDRVPSTRQLTQDWGVAMATATKALTALRQQGLVTAVPGVGTVVASARTPAPPRPREQDLSRDRIIAKAIEIADTEGLAAVSMRRLATELNAATMSLYRHVPGKDELVLLMADAVLAEDTLPTEPPADWRARLELSSRLQWAAYRRHPWLARTISLTRPQALPRGIAHTDWSLAALELLGLPPSTRLNAYLTLFGYVRGAAVTFEAEYEALRDTGQTPGEWMAEQGPHLAEMLELHRFPALARLLAHDFQTDLDAQFEFGLQRMLDGFEVFGAHPSRSTP
ncbi:TetR/AcrR family transcriptional regulator C-terminal domain-containing protein [Amycolatopsis endophytica]|uniref:DNA-binding transcriptional regulator YhcF (GntR family) n=1 Tax=Amycolatopsis endophytica TaxID=860233 RepID=A0A853B548_9PSEU|nr:TetR/AcrR family transcriptional regulator C-terminal domain-containing protein [Amycolatopsis endophytica]NYI89935.1 DNA-binding transcriptional regulator YhcF (GntR family) [Amycolatopsis endophytica]